MASRYSALLTHKQMDLLSCLDDEICTVPGLYQIFKDANPEWDLPVWTRMSIYASLIVLERRGLAIRNPGWTWPQEWTATEDGQRALELAETSDVLVPSR